MRGMKRFSALLALLLAFATAAPAQHTIPGAGGRYAWPAVSTTGYLGYYLDFRPYEFSPSTYAINWVVIGTAPTACTFYPEGSSNAETASASWDKLATSDATGATVTPFSCTTSGRFVISPKPVVYFHINLLSYTPGDGTTQVLFFYTRGSN